MDKEIKHEFEELGGMVARGFNAVNSRIDDLDHRLGGRLDGVDQRLDGIDQRLDGVDQRLDHLDARMGRMEADLAEIRGNIVYRHEFEDLMARVKYIEAKLKIKSGK